MSKFNTLSINALTVIFSPFGKRETPFFEG